MKPSNQTWQRAIQSGLKSVKATWPPMLLIQIITAATVVAYFKNPNFQQTLDKLGELQAQGGLPFVFISGFAAGSILPEIAKLLTGRITKPNLNWLKSVAYTGLVYALVAILVYYLYMLLGVWFGDTLSFATTVPKVIFDMLVFSPFLSIPFATGMFIWRRDKYKFNAWLKVIKPSQYREHVLPGLVLCWAFWCPVLSAVYCLPVRLQFPVAILCEAAWSILFVFSVGEHQAEPVLVE